MQSLDAIPDVDETSRQRAETEADDVWRPDIGDDIVSIEEVSNEMLGIGMVDCNMTATTMWISGGRRREFEVIDHVESESGQRSSFGGD